MIVLTSARPSSRLPVRAVTVTTEVISEPELVMNCFEPLSTHSPSTSSARVRVAPASDPGPGLGPPEAAQPLAGDQVRQPGLLLSVGAEGQDRVDSEPDGRLEGEAHRLVDAADLLDRDTEAGEVPVLARSAVLLGSGEPEQAEVTHLVHDVGREVVLLVPTRGMRRDLGSREVADAVPERLVLGG